MNPAHEALTEAAREHRGRLLAFLAARSGDVAGAEDALGEAFLEAVSRWDRDGVPGNPAAWLLRTAQRRMIDAARRRSVAEREEENVRELAGAGDDGGGDADIPDERLKLLFVCAHPAIDPSARAPLMLQTVLGLEASVIGSAFLTSPSSMSQRLVRAKAKIRAAGIPFKVPDAQEWPERLEWVLDAIYAAYTAGWDDPQQPGADLSAEAVFLARLAVELLPDEPEANGLAALMLHCESRRTARFHNGKFVPLLEQDPSRWDAALAREAEEFLRKAGRRASLGRFQLEAAIQSLHAERRVTGRVRWQALEGMYRRLVVVSDSIGARIGLAAALGGAGEFRRGLQVLDALDYGRIANHQPYWATRAHLLHGLGLGSEAFIAWQRAIGLTEHAAVREFLQGKMRVAASLGGKGD